MASSRPLTEKFRNSWSSNSSLLELAYKLRQAEFRVYGMLAPDRTSMMPTKEMPSDQKNLEKHIDETPKQSPFHSICSSTLLSSLDYSFDDALTTNVSLKSIQDRYRMFKASFPRFTDYDTAAMNENCKPMTNDANTSSLETVASDSILSNYALKISPCQKAASPTESEPQKRHQCDWCSYQTDSRSHLIRHQKAVHREVISNDSSLSVLSSDLCSTPIKPALAKQRSWCNMPNRRFKCDMCVYSTDCLSHLRRHQGCMHNKMMSYWCYICKKDFSRSEKTKSHFIAFHPNVPYDPRKIRKFSPQPRSKPNTAVEKWAKAKHQKKVEIAGNSQKKVEIADNNQKKVEISDNSCVDKVKEVKKTVIRVGNRKKKGKVKGREKRHSCPKCNYVSHGLWHMKRHMTEVHETSKEFSCKVCRYGASRQHRLVCHMDTHGELFCFFCDYSNSDMEIFKRHLNMCTALHRIGTVVRCHICQADCTDPSRLKSHINETHSLILHSCDLCPYYTDVPDEIYAHARLHVDDEHTCKLCNVTFQDDDQVSHHVETKHVTKSANKSYSCVLCCHEESEFVDMVRHVQSHEPTLFFCGHDLCNFKCSVENSRKLHWRYYHDDCVPELVANNSNELSVRAKVPVAENIPLESRQLKVSLERL